MAFHMTLDRIEEGIAVLLDDSGRRLLVPSSEIPSECREGTVLLVSFEPDPVETEARRARIRAARQRLENRGGA